MKILFVHQNFPAQFKHLAPALAADPANKVQALTVREGLPAVWQGVAIKLYRVAPRAEPRLHPWLADMEPKLVRGEACFAAARALRAEGFEPDVVIAHPAWGESLFIKQVWPRARLGLYCEFFYQSSGADTGFDPEFAPEDAEANACRLQLKNANQLLHFPQAALGIAPTHWQASTFPPFFRDRIRTVHDGIDTAALCPNAAARLTLQTAEGALEIGIENELITFVNRNLEPYRGYHIFMRALPALLRARPKARVLIVGGDGLSYGAAPKTGSSWKQVFVDEVRDRIAPRDWQRVHFLGKVPYPVFVALLQCSSVHVYLTYPFILSWSLLEAMSVGCAIVASNTAPLREAIREGETGRLVDFFDAGQLAATVCELLDDPVQRQRLGTAAREEACARYDLQRVCLPAQLQWVQELAAQSG